MTILKKLKKEFPGVSAIVAAIIGAVRAVYAYNKALKAMEALKIRDPVNAWIWDVSEHSLLSYSDAREIHTFLTEDSNAYKQTPRGITEFVIHMANCGHTKDMIILYLQQIDMELDGWASDKLKTRSK